MSYVQCSCHLSLILLLMQGMSAISSIASGSAAVSSAAWPSLATSYYNTNSLDSQLDSLKPLTRMTPSQAQQLLSVGNVSFAGNPNITILQVSYARSAAPIDLLQESATSN